jgi:hypothetical protein
MVVKEKQKDKKIKEEQKEDVNINHSLSHHSLSKHKPFLYNHFVS